MSQSVTKQIVVGKGDDALDISDLIQSLKFIQSIKKDDALELTAEGDNATYLLELSQLVTGATITFNFGYIGGEISPTYTAMITDIEPDYTTDGCQLKIKCGDRGRAMRKVRSKKIWKKKTTSQIIKEIADSHNMGFVTEVPIGGFIEYESMPQGMRDDLEFACELAKAEKDGNYIVFVSGNDLHLVTRKLDEKSQDNIVVGEYDKLIGFNIRYRETTSPNAAGEVGATAHDIDGATATAGKVNAITSKAYVTISDNPLTNGNAFTRDKDGKTTPLVANQSHLTKEGQKIFGASKSTTTSPTNQKAQTVKNNTKKEVSYTDQALALVTGGAEMITPGAMGTDEIVNKANSAHKSALHKVLTATLEEYGNPFRKMNTIITVGGIATRFNGNWLIQSVSHNLSGNKYVTSCELSKDGLKGSGGLNTTGTKNTEESKTADQEKVVIPIAGKNAAKAFEVNTVTGERKELKYTPPYGTNQSDKPASSVKGRFNKTK